MTTLHRFPIRRRWDPRLLAGSLAALALGLAACGDDSTQASAPAFAEQATTTTLAERPTELVDEAIAIAGGQMHLRCVAADLRSLLEEAGEPGPYVLLGHSFGGTEAVTFASQHPDEVVGLVLLDASPVTWPAAMGAVPDDGTDAANDGRALCAAMQDPAQDPERIDVIPAFDEIAAIASLDALPMTVMSGARRSWPGLADAELTRLTTVWKEG